MIEGNSITNGNNVSNQVVVLYTNSIIGTQ